MAGARDVAIRRDTSAHRGHVLWVTDPSFEPSAAVAITQSFRDRGKARLGPARADLCARERHEPNVWSG